MSVFQRRDRQGALPRIRVVCASTSKALPHGRASDFRFFRLFGTRIVSPFQGFVAEGACLPRAALRSALGLFVQAPSGRILRRLARGKFHPFSSRRCPARRGRVLIRKSCPTLRTPILRYSEVVAAFHAQSELLAFAAAVQRKREPCWPHPSVYPEITCSPANNTES